MFFQASSGLTVSLSFYHPQHRNPKSYVATSDNRPFLKQTSVLMVTGGKLVFSLHTDDIVRMGWAESCQFQFPFTAKREEFHPKVPRATSVFFFFFYPIRLEGTKHWTVQIRHLNSVDPHFKAFVCI